MMRSFQTDAAVSAGRDLMPFAGASPVTNLSRTDRKWLRNVPDLSHNDMVTLAALFP